MLLAFLLGCYFGGLVYAVLALTTVPANITIDRTALFTLIGWPVSLPFVGIILRSRGKTVRYDVDDDEGAE